MLNDIVYCFHLTMLASPNIKYKLIFIIQIILKVTIEYCSLWLNSDLILFKLYVLNYYLAFENTEQKGLRKQTL
jgi:hypothetical protein